jgi:hypothetical protein
VQGVPLEQAHAGQAAQEGEQLLHARVREEQRRLQQLLQLNELQGGEVTGA